MEIWAGYKIKFGKDKNILFKIGCDKFFLRFLTIYPQSGASNFSVFWKFPEQTFLMDQFLIRKALKCKKEEDQKIIIKLLYWNATVATTPPVYHVFV